ncbi:hypothetical protein Scep_013035 [Stephania cephalantha]|uniref:Uncharacterized protein n=1 Tax=Stephania cephalantha TaxID=152367 RepID=A0AAP0P712_9MAGN
MADLSRSRPPPQPSATTALSKKAFAASKNVYQDVFGGPPKFGLPNLSSRIDDYAEIFRGYHASRGSSIPFLDLPDVDESAFLTSKLDYSEVFGGSGRVDFAIPYEELFAEPAGVESSSEDVWSTPCTLRIQHLHFMNLFTHTGTTAHSQSNQIVYLTHLAHTTQTSAEGELLSWTSACGRPTGPDGAEEETWAQSAQQLRA